MEDRGRRDFHALTDGGGLTGGTAGTPTEIATGTLDFDTEGNLVSQTQTANFNQPRQALTFDFGDPTATGGTGTKGFTQFGEGVSTTTFTGQDGNGYGALSSVSINNKGEARLTNAPRACWQVAVADFKSSDKLDRIGGNRQSSRRPQASHHR